MEMKYTAFCGVSGMTHSQSVKVRPQVFTAKCSEPQVESREAGMEEVVQRFFHDHEQKSDIRPVGRKRLQHKSNPKGKRKTQMVNQGKVGKQFPSRKKREGCVDYPERSHGRPSPKSLKTVMVGSVETRFTMRSQLRSQQVKPILKDLMFVQC